MHTVDTIIVAPVSNPYPAERWLQPDSRFTTTDNIYASFLDVVVHAGSGPFAPTLAEMQAGTSILGYDGFMSRPSEYDGFREEGCKSDILHFFPYQSFGHTLAYWSECSVHCRNCAYKHWQETGEYLQPVAMGQDAHDSMGVDCEACYVTIVEPYCVGCCTEDYSGPWFTSTSGEDQYCGRCMAGRVLDGSAVKTGILQYTLDSMGEYRCEYTSDGRSTWAMNYNGKG